MNLKKTIEVLIVNFEIKELKELEYHSKWKRIEEKDRKLILTEDLELHIIEIPKIYYNIPIDVDTIEKGFDIDVIKEMTKLTEEEIKKL